MSGPYVEGPADQQPGAPTVTRTRLFDDDVWCVRGKEWAGPEGDTCYVVKGEGVVCSEHVTDEERARAVPPR